MKDQILLVDSGAKARGFFSTINLTLITIQYCYEINLIPVIATSVLSLYGTDSKKIRPFSEFFGDVFSGDLSNANVIEIDYVHNRSLLECNNSTVIKNLALTNKILLENMNEDLKRFVDIPPSGNYLNTSVSVHYRGCDYLKNTPRDHTKNSTPSEFLKKISELINGKKVFVATDDNSFVKLMETSGYELSFFEDVYRGRPGKGAHFKSFLENLGLINKNKQKIKGYEVIRDVHWLSKNSTYIGSNSNLMYYSKLLNPEQIQVNLSK